jgi:hypothetical protein
MIRIAPVITLCFLLGAFTASAGFKLPKDIYRVQNLKEAQDEARAKGRPICILYTDADSKCGLATQAALDAIDALDNKTILVYVNSNNEGGFLPSVIKKAFESPESGQYIPKTVVLDAELTEIIALIPYSSERERKVRFTKAKTAISAWQKTSGPAAGEQSPAAKEGQPTMRTWTSASGKTIEGRFTKLQQDMVVLTKPDGTSLQIHISKLSAADQVLARQLASTATPASP